VSSLAVCHHCGKTLLTKLIGIQQEPVTTKAQQNADHADGAENAEMKSAILLRILRKQ
jgi:hypothetical protein